MCLFGMLFGHKIKHNINDWIYKTCLFGREINQEQYQRLGLRNVSFRHAFQPQNQAQCQRLGLQNMSFWPQNQSRAMSTMGSTKCVLSAWFSVTKSMIGSTKHVFSAAKSIQSNDNNGVYKIGLFGMLFGHKIKHNIARISKLLHRICVTCISDFPYLN